MRGKSLLLFSTLVCTGSLGAPALANSGAGGASAPGGAGAKSAQVQGSTTPDQAPQGPSQGSVASSTRSGGLSFVNPVRPSQGRLIAAGMRAKIVHGLAYAPAGAPIAVQKAIWAANRIVGLPYVYGGGHQAFKATGYDCSGTVSYALHGGSLLSTPEDSGTLESFGAAGAGAWITIYANGGHTYMTVAGIRLDTSRADDPAGGNGPRWRPLRHSDGGYTVRHPTGL